MKKSFLSALTLIVLAIGFAAPGALAADQAFLDMCKNGTPDDVESAIKNGADANAYDEDNRRALMYAARYNKNPEVVSRLIAAGADVNPKGYRVYREGPG